MSRKKHNVSYIKPDEPKFLRELKKQAGYKEGPTVDTKVKFCMQVIYCELNFPYNYILYALQIIFNNMNFIYVSLNQKEALPEISDDEREDSVDEKPVVVVLHSGDLTAEEADAFQKQKERGIKTCSEVQKLFIQRVNFI